MTTVILRLEPHENCAQNNTGVIVNPNVNAEEPFDAFCYDDTGDHILKRCLQNMHNMHNVHVVYFKTWQILFSADLCFLHVWHFVVGPEKNCDKEFSSYEAGEQAAVKQNNHGGHGIAF